MGFQVDMNPSDPEEDDALRAKLRAWQVDPEVPPGFQREVWQRIAAHQAAEGTSLAARWREFLIGFLYRPVFAAVLMLVCLGGSFAYGRAKAAEANTLSWQHLEERYTLAINPLAHQVVHLNGTEP